MRNRAGPFMRARLLDHLVGPGEQCLWHSEAKRLGGLEVDEQLVFRRHLHRQVGRLLAFKDTIDITGRTPVLVDEISPVGNQAAGGGEGALEVDRKSTRLNSSHANISYAVFCLKKKKNKST